MDNLRPWFPIPPEPNRGADPLRAIRLSEFSGCRRRRGAACCAQNSNPLSAFQIGSKGVRCPLHGVASLHLGRTLGAARCAPTHERSLPVPVGADLIYASLSRELNLDKPATCRARRVQKSNISSSSAFEPGFSHKLLSRRRLERSRVIAAQETRRRRCYREPLGTRSILGAGYQRRALPVRLPTKISPVLSFMSKWWPGLSIAARTFPVSRSIFMMRPASVS